MNQTYANEEGNKQNIETIYEHLFERYPRLKSVRSSIWEAYRILETCYAAGGKLLIAGNGGSCADAEHMVGELMKGFLKKRSLPDRLKNAIQEADPNPGSELAEKLQGALPAIALSSHAGLATAFLNDVDGEMFYAQQLCGYAAGDDVFLGITTSGNAKNVDYAVTVAKARGMKVIGLTGKDGGTLGKRADAAIIVPEMETYQIQELHLPIYHTLCLMLEERFFKE